MSDVDPPDWALPSWDAVPADPGDRTDRLRPVGPGSSPGAAGDPGASRRPAAPGTFGVRILGVSEVTRAIRGAVRTDPRLADLWVEGEIGRVTVSSAGHAYFALKDDRNQLQCVWFRDQRIRSAFEAQAGLRVVAHGRIDLFEPQGALQLYVESIQPAGLGDLTLRFEALKARLAAEGLFDAGRKRRLPVRPATIAVITSPSGAVWKDICHVLGRRWPLARVVLVAAQVQGEAAPRSLVSAFRKVERYAAERAAAGRPDEAPGVTILARGGGSLEDLWAFNDEAVVRAVVAHSIPVVCGVGHEADVTLADFAADVRAPTPSAAAEVVVPDRAESLVAIRASGRRLDGAAAGRLRAAAREVVGERRALDRLSPVAQLASARERVGLLLDRGTRAIGGALAGRRSTTERLAGRLGPTLPARLARERVRLARADALDPVLVRRLAGGRASLGSAAAALAVLGPQATLDRGYAIVRRVDDTRIVRDPADAPPGTRLALRVARGDVPATADDR
ncbi:MAG TPA: exodeoxyribonuclease VII large subunit [Candidatus Limnocylindrales bacterium]|nr:exodeoxyribonuclease VII large subunit [Candidatus Limnocylindrales bacterium]